MTAADSVSAPPKPRMVWYSKSSSTQTRSFSRQASPENGAADFFRKEPASRAVV